MCFGQSDYLEIWNHERFPRSCCAIRSPTTTRGRWRSSGSDDDSAARTGHRRRDPVAAGAGARRPVRGLHGRSRRARPGACSSRGVERARPGSRPRCARDRAARARGVRRSRRARPRRLSRAGPGARRRAASPALAARWRISASRRCSSTPRAAASAFSATSRSTCGWIAAPAPTAADLLQDVEEEELANLIFQYGEERYSRRIARAIVRARESAPIVTTGQLAPIVRRAIPVRGYQRIDPATRTFQALRIWVNRELEGLDDFLRAAARRLLAGARLAVIAFHSLEDRIVKHTFRALAPGRGRGARAHQAPARGGRRRGCPQPAGPQREASRD